MHRNLLSLLFAVLVAATGLSQTPSFDFQADQVDPQTQVLTLQWNPGYGMVLERSQDMQTWERVDWHYTFGEEVAYELFRVLKPDEEPKPVDPDAPPLVHPQYIYRTLTDGSGMVVTWPRGEGQEPGQAFLSGLTLPPSGVSSPVYGKTLETADAIWNFTVVYQGELETLPVISYSPTPEEQANLNAFRQVWPLISTDFGNQATAQVNYNPGSAPDATDEKYFWRVRRVTLDSDGDGIYDHVELGRENPTDPFNPDSDGDGTSDGEEDLQGTDPNGHADITDTDEDGILDSEDADPGDSAVRWLRAPGFSYLVLPLGQPFSGRDDLPNGGLRDLGSDGRVLAADDSRTTNGEPSFLTKVFTPETGAWTPVPMTSSTSGLEAYGGAIDGNGNIYGLGLRPLPLIEWPDGHTSLAGGPGVQEVIARSNLAQSGYTAAESIGVDDEDFHTESADYLMAHPNKARFAVEGSGACLAYFGHRNADGDNHLDFFRLSLLPGQAGSGGVLEEFSVEEQLPAITLRGAESGLLSYSVKGNADPETRHKLVGLRRPGEVGHWMYELDVPAGDGDAVRAVGRIESELIPDLADEALVWSGENNTHILQDGAWNLSSRRVGDPLRLRGRMNARGECILGNGQLLKNAELLDLDDLVEGSGYSNLRGVDINDSSMILAIGDSAGDEAEGSQPLLMLPVEMLSRDRMLAGSFKIAEGWESSLKMEFVHKETGQNLGTYSHLLTRRPDGAYVYDSSFDVLGDEDQAAFVSGNLDPRITGEHVVFCLRPDEPGVVEFYTIFDSLGEIEIRFHMGDRQLGAVTHLLEEDTQFSEVIDYVNRFILEDPLGDNAAVAALGDDSSTAARVEPLDGATPVANGFEMPPVAPLTKKAMVPIVNGLGAVIGQVTSIEAVLFGLFDGIKQGVLDDWAIIDMVGKAGLNLAQDLPAALEQEVRRWMENPEQRAFDIAALVVKVVDEGVMQPAHQAALKAEQLADRAVRIADNFTSLEKFKKFSWRAMKKAKRAAKKAGRAAVHGVQLAVRIRQDVNAVVGEALLDWLEDFCNRMYDGAEKTAFGEEPMGGIGLWTQKQREFNYTFGYTFGYLAEQVYLLKGVGAVAKGISKAGGKIALSSIPGVKRFLVRVLPFISKKWSQQVLSTADNNAFHAALRETQTEALEVQTRNGVGIATDAKRAVSETLDELVEGQLGKINGKLLEEEIRNAPRIMQMLRNQATRKIFKSRLAMLHKIMGDKLDDEAARSFVRFYDKRLIKNVDEGSDIFDEFLVAIHNQFPNGSRALVDQVAGNPAAVNRFELFFKPPSEYSPWKAGFGTVNQWGHASRGRLIQLFEAYFGSFKPPRWKNLDVLDKGVIKHNKGLDFAELAADGTPTGVYAEVKTTASPTPDLRAQLRKSVDALNSSNGHTLEFHVYHLSSNPTPDLSALENLATQLANAEDITIRIIKKASSFQHLQP